MRVLLVHPAPPEPGRLGLENVIWLSEPVALTSIAAVVPDHDVRILDMRLEPPGAYVDELRRFRPDVVGTTSMTTDCDAATQLLRDAKSCLGDDVFTIVGGHHPTLVPDAFDVPWIDARCIGDGEETFRALLDHLVSQGRGNLESVSGLRLHLEGAYRTTASRVPVPDLDALPHPARHLVNRYRNRYFFTAAGPLASIATSRGCSFDCNFCAIWEFYERTTRFMSASAICDRLEGMDEEFVLFLDDNFLTKPSRLDALVEEIERRGIRKTWGIQGRTDFIAAHPDRMRRLRDAGLALVISGFESNDDAVLESLLKRSTVATNQQAAALLRELGILCMGIFMVRPEFTEADFHTLYAHINELGIGLPLVTILTPLPGTALWRARREDLLTTDARFFDLLHAVVPTRLPRRRFYERFADAHDATQAAVRAGARAFLARHPRFWTSELMRTIRWFRRARRYWAWSRDVDRVLREELGFEAKAPTRNERSPRALDPTPYR